MSAQIRRLHLFLPLGLSGCAAAIILQGCQAYDCTLASASVDVYVRTGDMPVQVRSLEFIAEVQAERYEQFFSVDEALRDGQTSLRIDLGEIVSKVDTLDLTVRAYSGDAGTGDRLAETRQRTTLTPDGCNELVLSLWPERVVCASDCSVDCAHANSCAVDCQPGARCFIDCQGAERCDAVCQAGSSCSIDCHGAGDCSLLSCGTNSSCSVQCDPGAPCGFADCSGLEVSCPGGLVLCNGYCP